MIFPVFFEGLLVSLGLLTAIGPQNAYVLRQGLRCRHVFAVSVTTCVSDALMITIGVMGVGITLHKFPLLSDVLGWGGVLFLLWFAWASIRRAQRPDVIDQNSMDAAAGDAKGQSVKVAILHALAFAWLNPWAYVDTMALLGGISTKYPFGEGKLSFLFGAISASAIWFFGIAAGARKAAPLFVKKVTWQILDSLIAIIMVIMAVMLAGYLWRG
jgi:L-lysine exporter family protein LysE/ArgO